MRLNSLASVFAAPLLAWLCFAQEPSTVITAPPTPASQGVAGSLSASDTYTLGPEDTVLIRVLNLEEITNTPYAIDLNGNMSLPRIGRVHAAGLTLDQLETELTQKFKEYLQNPVVNISVADYHSQPVSVLGEVAKPGIHQIQGRKTLFEVISEAGGLKDGAGGSIKITRRKEWGSLPLPGARFDQTGQFSVADVSVHSIMDATNPQENIPIRPNDVISVPKAELIYVLGAVKKPGGFVLAEKSNMSVLQALSLAEGLDKAAGSNRAKILRSGPLSQSRVEIPIDVKKIMASGNGDEALMANDILFIPTSTAKLASLRAIEALISTGSGIAIYTHP